MNVESDLSMNDVSNPNDAPEKTAETKNPRRMVVGTVAALVAVVCVVVALSQFGVWRVFNPPSRYHQPEGATADEQRAIQVAQDAVREKHGTLVELDRTTIFTNQFGNYRVRGAVMDPFSENKSVFVYEAIVDAKSFECLEFRSVD